jgi:hypothetical protein
LTEETFLLAVQARKHFLLKKGGARQAGSKIFCPFGVSKSFLVLFLKKELLPFFYLLHLWPRLRMSQTQGNLVQGNDK